MRTYLYLTMILCPILASTGCGNRTHETEYEFTKITNVLIYTVKGAAFEEHINLPVVVKPYREVALGLTGGGKVTKIHADKGDKVTVNQELLETDDVQLRAALQSAEATLEYQKSEFERSEKLFQEGSITQAAFDLAKLQFAQSKSAHDIAKKQLEDAVLKAPFSGVVTMRNVEIGEILGPGTPAFRIIDIHKVKVQAGIPEKLIIDFKEGSSVNVIFDAIPGIEFTGQINYIAPEASLDVRTFLAEIVVDNRDGLIRAGIIGNAQLLKKLHEKTLMIPLNAVIQTQEGQIVFVVEEGNIAGERSVEMGPSSELMVLIKRGLAPGDKVVVKGQHDLVNGEKLNITGEFKFDY